MSFLSWLSLSLLSLLFSFFPPYCPFLLCSVFPFSHSYFLSSLHFFHIFYLIFLLFFFFLLLIALFFPLSPQFLSLYIFPFPPSSTFFSFVASFFSFSCLLPPNLLFVFFPTCEARRVCLREWAGYADV